MTGCEGCFSFESERTSSEQRAYSDILKMEISCLGKKDDIESLSTRSTKRQRETTKDGYKGDTMVLTAQSTYARSTDGFLNKSIGGLGKLMGRKKQTLNKKMKQVNQIQNTREGGSWGSKKVPVPVSPAVTCTPTMENNSITTVRSEIEEINRRLSRMNEIENKRKEEEKVRDIKTKAMTSLLYRVDDKAHENEKDIRTLASSMNEDLEVTRGALEILTVKLNEIAVRGGVETIEDMVKDAIIQDIEMKDEEKKDKPMPAQDGLSGMDTE